MRFETDACFAEAALEASSLNAALWAVAGRDDSEDTDTQSSPLEDVTSSLDQLSLTDELEDSGSVADASVVLSDINDIPETLPRSHASGPERDPAHIAVVMRGEMVPASTLVELTTRHRFNRYAYWDELCDQIFLSEIRHLRIGVYDKHRSLPRHGELLYVDNVHYASQRLAKARQQQMVSYRQLEILLRRIYNVAVDLSQHTQRMSLVCMNGKLGLYRRLDGNVALPDEYLALFDT